MKATVQFLVVQFMDQEERTDPASYIGLIAHQAVLSVLPHVPLHIWPMAQIVIGHIPYYVAMQTSYMINFGKMLDPVLPHCRVLDILVETTNGVYFSGFVIAFCWNALAHISKYALIVSKMQSLVSTLTTSSPAAFKHCLQIVWSEIPLDIDVLVRSIETLTKHYEPVKVYFKYYMKSTPRICLDTNKKRKKTVCANTPQWYSWPQDWSALVHYDA